MTRFKASLASTFWSRIRLHFGDLKVEVQTEISTSLKGSFGRISAVFKILFKSRIDRDRNSRFRIGLKQDFAVLR